MARPTKASMRAALAEINDEYVGVEELETIAPSGILALVGMPHANIFQENIFNFFQIQLGLYQRKLPTTSLLVEAVAGSGKTTTIVAAASLIPKALRTTFLAFNKPIAEELKSRLPSHVDSQTLNSLGYSILRPYVRTLGCSIGKDFCNKYRTQSLIKSEYDWKQRQHTIEPVTQLVARCKSVGIIPVGVDDGYALGGLEATDDTLLDLIKHFDDKIDPVIRPTVFAMTRNILRKSWSDTTIYETNCIDFDDQKWLTVCKRPNGNKMVQPMYDVVIVDEAQDLNVVDIELIKMILRPNGIVIGVGDRNQAIYGFRGADTNAIDTFGKAFNTQLMPLSITYRCGAEIVEYAQELVPSIQAAPNAHSSTVAHLTAYGPATFRPGDLVLCRNNAPLIDIAFKLIKARVPVYVKGRNIGVNLVSLIKQCVGKDKWITVAGRKRKVVDVDGKTTTMLYTELMKWQKKQTDTILRDDPDDEDGKQLVQDRVDSLMVFIDGSVDGKVSTIIDSIDELFTNTDIRNMVILSSIHKAKGLEAERVFIHRPDLLYPWYVHDETWQYYQEKNMDYVARTRAKSFYGILTMDGWDDNIV